MVPGLLIRWFDKLFCEDGLAGEEILKFDVIDNKWVLENIPTLRNPWLNVSSIELLRFFVSKDSSLSSFPDQLILVNSFVD